MNNFPNLLTIDEARKILKVGKNVMYSLIAQGLPHIKIGKQIRIPIESLEQWINEQMITI